MVVVVGGMLLAGLVALLVGPEPAAYLIAALVAGLAGARAMLPPARVQPFVIRDRWLDVTLMGSMAVALIVLAVIAPF